MNKVQFSNFLKNYKVAESSDQLKQYGRMYEDRLKTTVRYKAQDQPPRYANDKLSFYCNFLQLLHDIV